MSWYVASPYSHPDPAMREERYRTAVTFVAWAAAERMLIYSPIVHWHVAARTRSLPTDADFWAWINQSDQEHSDGVMVLAIPGWRQSTGVQEELLFAARWSQTVRFFRPADAAGWRWTEINEREARMVR